MPGACYFERQAGTPFFDMTAPRPFRFGILGTGMVAAYHRQAIVQNGPSGAELVCVGHYDPARFAQLEAQFGVPCRDEEAMLADPDVDAVIICTPSGQHAAQAVAAARAGKHVLVEKPMALSLADADRMIEACDAAGVTLGVVYQRRFDPEFQTVQRAISNGELGKLTLGVLTLPYFRGQAYYDSAAWRGTWSLDGGGVLMNQGIHMVDVLVWFMGDPVDICGRAATLDHAIEVEDVAAATMRFADGALATIAATTTAQPGFAHRLAVYGTYGGIQIEGERVVERTALGASRPASVPGNGREPGDAGTGGDPRGIAPIGHVRAVADFMEAVRAGRSPAVDGVEGRRSLAAVLGIYRAAGLVLA